ncbi:polygalacturonase [Halobacteriales archaeon QS_4_69_31]|nr:MAG: polygalacturonase [Halobacteriales archaeon QS_4_69_31]
MENVRDHGAHGDGTDATDAVQAAIDTCGDEGGGRVHVPPGEYETAPLELHSGVNLHLAGGATVRASGDADDYETDDVPHRSFITAVDAEDVAVTGRGTIDCNGRAFMRDAVIDPRDGHYQPVPREESPDGPLFPDDDRPDRALFFYRCSNVQLRNVTVRDAPHWTVHLLACDEVDARGVDVLNDRMVPNNDGINPDMSRNVHISDCTVRAGDDAICVKADGRYPEARPCENVTVTNCTLQSRSCGIKLGSESEYDIRNCLFANCTITDSNRGVGIQNRDAGDIERIAFTDLVVETRHHTGNWWGIGEPVSITSLPRTAETDLGTLRDVRLSNLTVEGEGSVVVYADPDDPVCDLRIEGVTQRVTTGDHSADRNAIDLRPGEVDGGVRERDLPAVFLHGVDRATLQDVTVEWADSLPYHTHALECEGFGDLVVDGFRGRQADDGAAVALSDGGRAVVRRCLADDGTDVFLATDDVEHVTATDSVTDAARTGRTTE